MGAQQPAEVPSDSGAQKDTDGDEPFPTHVTARDQRAFAEQVLDHHAEQIYRYVVAWTGDSDGAVALTAQVLRTAVSRMERLTEPGADLEARLIALARAAVARRTEAEREAAARDAGAFTASEPVPLLLDAVAHLDDARREVLILRQLLGHSTEHAARLLAFDAPVVDELERDACATLWRRLNHAPQTKQVTSWDALTVAAALRQGAKGWVPPPDPAVLASLREQLLGGLGEQRKRPAVVSAAAAAAAQRRGLLSSVLAFAVRRRWLLAGCVASATIGTVLALSMGAEVDGSSSPCGAPTCLVSTTVVMDDATPSTPSTPEQSSELSTSTTRASAGPVFPAVTNRGTRTTRRSTTTTMEGTSSSSSTTRPPSSTTTATTARTTTTTTTPQLTTGTTVTSTTIDATGAVAAAG